jgi:hypothetical protein
LASSRDSSNGPDWTDVAVCMAALEEFHAVDVSLQMLRDGARDSGSIKLVAIAKRKLATNGVAPPSVSRARWLTEHRPDRVAAMAFRLLYELDLDCSTMWAQTELFTA